MFDQFLNLISLWTFDLIYCFYVVSSTITTLAITISFLV